MIRFPESFLRRKTMNPSNPKFSFLAIPLLILIAASAVIAQPPPEQFEPSFDVALYVVIGSNDAGRGVELPPNLSSISKRIKGNFSFSNYRLANTFFGRVTNTGSVEYKSVSNILGQETEGEAPTFTEWSLAVFRSLPNGYQARGFRFGARVPVRTATTAGGPVINYESVGLSSSVISLPTNTPTLIGTISLPKTSGTIFLVATIKPAEM